MTSVLEGLLIHGHMVAELDDAEPEPSVSVAAAPRRDAPPARRRWRATLRDAIRSTSDLRLHGRIRRDEVAT